RGRANSLEHNSEVVTRFLPLRSIGHESLVRRIRVELLSLGQLLPVDSFVLSDLPSLQLLARELVIRCFSVTDQQRLLPRGVRRRYERVPCHAGAWSEFTHGVLDLCSVGRPARRFVDVRVKDFAVARWATVHEKAVSVIEDCIWFWIA